MNIWFTSDQHIGHKLMAELRGFETVEEHDETLLENWNSVIKPDDRVYVLGDLTMKSPDVALEWFKRANGTKRLIFGNHDAGHPMHRTADRYQPGYLEVFDTVATAGLVKIEGRRVLMSHFPYTKDRGYEVRYPQWRLPDLGALLLHGHTHQAERYLSDHEMHIGLDAWDLMPVPMAEVAKWVRDCDIKARSWMHESTQTIGEAVGLA